MHPARLIAVQICLAAGFAAEAWGQTQPAAVCPSLDEVRAEAAGATPQDYAVTRDYTDNRGDTRHRQARYDPARGWSLELRNDAPPSEKFMRKYRKDPPPPPPSYARVAPVLDGDVRCLDADEARAVYAVDSLGASAIMLDDEDISPHFSAEVVLDRTAARPFVSEIRFSLKEPFKPNWLVRVTEAQGRVVFTRKDDGIPMVMLREFTASGSRPFGSFDYETRAQFSDHARVGER